MPTKSELMHYRLQAWLRENQCDEFEYLGERPDALRSTTTLVSYC